MYMDETFISVVHNSYKPGMLVFLKYRYLLFLQEIRKPGVKSGWVPGTMSIKATDLPTKPEEVHMKMFVLLERRLSRHYSSKVKLCVSCYYNCLELKGHYNNELVDKILSATCSMCVSTILQQLQEGRYFLKTCILNSHEACKRKIFVLKLHILQAQWGISTNII